MGRLKKEAEEKVTRGREEKEKMFLCCIHGPEIRRPGGGEA